MRKTIALVALFAACASSQALRQVKAYRAAKDRHDDPAAARYVASDARLYFEKKEGDGEPLGTGGGTWTHWDMFFRSHTTMSQWRAAGNEVSAVVHEMNDFYRYLEWTPAPYRITWTVDDRGLIRSVLITSIPGAKTVSRMSDFKAWARATHPDELAYLMPRDQIDPRGDRAERFKAILIEWRRAAGLPALSF